MESAFQCSQAVLLSPRLSDKFPDIRKLTWMLPISRPSNSANIDRRFPLYDFRSPYSWNKLSDRHRAKNASTRKNKREYQQIVLTLTDNVIEWRTTTTAPTKTIMTTTMTTIMTRTTPTPPTTPATAATVAAVVCQLQYGAGLPYRLWEALQRVTRRGPPVRGGCRN